MAAPIAMDCATLSRSRESLAIVAYPAKQFAFLDSLISILVVLDIGCFGQGCNIAATKHHETAVYTAQR
jgi:hypothetical protein